LHINVQVRVATWQTYVLIFRHQNSLDLATGSNVKDGIKDVKLPE
jgi:hypothetical protein